MLTQSFQYQQILTPKKELHQAFWLTHEMRNQGIPVLESSFEALEELVAKELQENPELQVENQDLSEPSEDSSCEELQDWVIELERMGQDTWDDWNSYASRGQRKDNWADSADGSFYENTLIDEVSLYGLLLKELKQSFLSVAHQRIGYALIEELDEHGFLGASLDSLAITLEVNVSSVEQVLAVIQDFAPAGVAARNLQECLLLQLKRQGRDDQLESDIVRDCWAELIQGNISRIRQLTAKTADEVALALAKIAHLNNRPGSVFGQQSVSVVPDAFIRQATDGSWLVSVNKGEQTLRVNNEPIRNGGDRQVASFYNGQRRNASRFIEMLEFRNQTLLKVVAAIVAKQRRYFEQGEAHLTPLTQSEIAQEVGFSEATLSRLVNNKYVQTPFGILSLQYFFDSGVDTFAGGRLAAKAVKSRIRQMVANEVKSKPHSDQVLTNYLILQGIDISCRGVNKYRQDMQIGSTRERRWG